MRESSEAMPGGDDRWKGCGVVEYANAEGVKKAISTKMKERMIG